MSRRTTEKKGKSMKKTIAFALIIAVILTSMVGVISFASSDGGETPRLEIAYANMRFGEKPSLLIAVDYTALKGEGVSAIDLKLDVTDKSGKVKSLDPNMTLSYAATTPKNCAVFRYNLPSAEKMGDVLTLKAYLDGMPNSDMSCEIEYSFLEYAVKAKAVGGAELAGKIDEVLLRGAAAQKTAGYTGDYKLFDGDGAVDYGMILFSGIKAGEKSKIIASAGSKIAVPAANPDVFKSECALYDLSFNEVELTASGNKKMLTVVAGLSRYFYYGADLYDNPVISATSAEGVGHYAGNLTSLELDRYLGEPAMYDFHRSSGYISWGSVKYITSLINSTEADGVTNKYYSTTGDIESLVTSNETIGVNSLLRAWAFRTFVPVDSSGKLSEKTVNSDANTGIAYITMENGYMYFNAGESYDYYASVGDGVDLGNNGIAIYNRLSARPADFLVDGKMTVSVALALDGKCEDFESFCFFGDNTYNYCSSNSVFLDLFKIASDGTLTVGGMEVVTVNTFDEDNPEFTTVHFVLDTERGTVTAYTEDGGASSAVYTVQEIGANRFTSAEALEYFTWLFKGSVYVNRITVSEGNLFN